MTAARVGDPIRPRAAIIGAGAFGEQHARAFNTDEWELAAIADTNPDRAGLVADRYRIPAHFSDAATLLREIRPDAVSIATTPGSQKELAIVALDAGCTVLLEKPVALSTADADQLLAHDVDHRILPGHVLRFASAFVSLREQVRAGAVGDILGVSARRDRERGHVQRYDHTHPAFLTSIHDIDLAGWITGATARSVSARAASSGRGTHPDLFIITVGDSRGGVWSLRTAWVLPTDAPPSDRLEVYGTEGVAAVEVAGDRVTLEVADATSSVRTERVDELTALRSEIAHLRARTIDPATKPVITLTEARAAVAVAEAAITSAGQRGVPIEVGR